MNRDNIRALHKIGILSTYFIDLCNEEKQKKTWFKHNVARWGGKFLDEIIKVERLIMNVGDKKELLELSDMMVNNAESIDALMEIWLDIDDDKERMRFNELLENAVNEFNNSKS